MKNAVKIATTWKDGTTHTGFGFIVGDKEGRLFLATAGHLLRDQNGSPEQEFARGTVEFCAGPAGAFEASLDTTDLSESLDVGVLTVTMPKDFTWLRDALEDPNSVRFTSEVVFIGTAGQCEVPASVGRVNNARAEVDSPLDVIIEGVAPGTSGSPLVSQNGLVGMIVASPYGSRVTALNAFRIKKTLEQARLPWALTNSYLSVASPVRSDAHGIVRGLDATLKDRTGRPLAGVPVIFSVNGPPVGTDSVFLRSRSAQEEVLSDSRGRAISSAIGGAGNGISIMVRASSPVGWVSDTRFVKVLPYQPSPRWRWVIAGGAVVGVVVGIVTSRGSGGKPPTVTPGTGTISP